MTTPNNPAKVAPDRIGLTAAAQKVKDVNADDNGEAGAVPSGTEPPKKETRGRKSKAEKEAQTDAQWEELATYATNLIKQPMNMYAQEVDPYLPLVGYPKGSTFGMTPEEEVGTKTALKIVISKINPEWLIKWAPWIVCGGIILQLTVPRFIMTSKIRAYIKQQEEKDDKAVDTTGKPADDNNK